MEEDLVQECLLHWWLQRSRYDEARGANRRTFMNRVCEHRLWDLWRGAHASQRWSPRGTLSLDAPATEGGDPLAELLEDSAHGPDVLAEYSELLALIARLRSRLTPRQQEVLDGLHVSRTVAEIARELGVHRDTVYEDRRRIQNACRDAGLEDFLR